MCRRARHQKMCSHSREFQHSINQLKNNFIICKELINTQNPGVGRVAISQHGMPEITQQ
jgi:hypothetical protein